MKTKQDYIAAGTQSALDVFEGRLASIKRPAAGWQQAAYDAGYNTNMAALKAQALASTLTGVGSKPVYRPETSLVKVFKNEQRKLYSDAARRANALIARAKLKLDIARSRGIGAPGSCGKGPAQRVGKATPYSQYWR